MFITNENVIRKPQNQWRNCFNWKLNKSYKRFARYQCECCSVQSWIMITEEKRISTNCCEVVMRRLRITGSNKITIEKMQKRNKEEILSLATIKKKKTAVYIIQWKSNCLLTSNGEQEWWLKIQGLKNMRTVVDQLKDKTIFWKEKQRISDSTIETEYRQIYWTMMTLYFR